MALASKIRIYFCTDRKIIATQYAASGDYQGRHYDVFGGHAARKISAAVQMAI
jgi:hypothetical protein